VLEESVEALLNRSCNLVVWNHHHNHNHNVQYHHNHNYHVQYVLRRETNACWSGSYSFNHMIWIRRNVENNTPIISVEIITLSQYYITAIAQLGER
jgi:hypothetical protein